MPTASAPLTLPYCSKSHTQSNHRTRHEQGEKIGWSKNNIPYSFSELDKILVPNASWLPTSPWLDCHSTLRNALLLLCINPERFCCCSCGLNGRAHSQPHSCPTGTSSTRTMASGNSMAAAGWSPGWASEVAYQARAQSQGQVQPALNPVKVGG